MKIKYSIEIKIDESQNYLSSKKLGAKPKCHE